MKIKGWFFRYLKEIYPFKAAVASVVIAIVATVCISAISESGKNIINNEMDAMGMNGLAVAIYNNSGENVTDISLYNNITDMKDTSKATPVIVNPVEIEFPNGICAETMGWGINENAPDIVSLQLINGRMINRQDIDSNAFVCLVDENIAEKVYKRNNICGKKIMLSTGEKTAVFEVIGTIKKGSSVLNTLSGNVMPDFVYIPHTTMKNMCAKSGYDQIIFNSSNTNQEAAQFKQTLTEISYRYNNKTVNLTNLSQHKYQINNITDTAFMALFAVSCVAVIVCSISVASSVNTAVITKQKDIGIKMSMGASRFDIVKEFIFSAVLSCFTGITIALLIVFLLINITELIFQYDIKSDLSLIAVSISATIMLTTVFSLIPSFKAADMPPIKALNRE